MVLSLSKIVSGVRGASCWTRLPGILVLQDPFISGQCRGQARSSDTSGTLTHFAVTVGEKQLERMLARALLEDKRFLVHLSLFQWTSMTKPM